MTLAAAGLVQKSAYSQKPVRHQYELTAKGRGLLPLLAAMEEWAYKYVSGVKAFPKFDRSSPKG